MLYADFAQASVHLMYAFIGAMVVFIIGVVIFKKKRLETI